MFSNIFYIFSRKNIDTKSISFEYNHTIWFLLKISKIKNYVFFNFIHFTVFKVDKQSEHNAFFFTFMPILNYTIKNPVKFTILSTVLNSKEKSPIKSAKNYRTKV